VTDDLRSAVRAGIQTGPNSVGLVPDQFIQPVWGRILDSIHNRFGDDGKQPDRLEWVEVAPDNDGKWIDVTDKGDFSYGRKSKTEEIDGEDFVVDPAVEINGGAARIGDVVRLWPSRVITTDEGISHRAWLFSVSPNLRCFVLAEDYIPDARDPGAGDRELYRTLKGVFIDSPSVNGPFEDVTLYPAHRAVFREDPFDDEDDADGNTWDQLVSLGFATFNAFGSFLERGTMGWAQWKQHGTRLGYNEDGSIRWRGEWQIVTLYAEQITELKVVTADIEPGETGKAEWRWLAQPPERRSDSGYEVEVFNDLETPLHVGVEFKAYFSRNHYVFVPLGVPDWDLFGVVQAGFANASGAAERTVSIRPSERDGTLLGAAAFNAVTELKPCSDTNLIAGNVVRYRYQQDGTALIVSDIWDLPIGRVVLESVDETNLRQGWRLCDGTQGAAFAGNSPDMRGRYPMGLDLADAAGTGDEDDIGDTGGTREITVSTLGVSATGAIQRVEKIDEEGDVFGADEVDVRGRFYVMAYIQRCDQRA